jgi:hypothetical protein
MTFSSACASIALLAVVAAPESSDADRPEAPEPMYAETKQLLDLVERAAAVVKAKGKRRAQSSRKRTVPGDRETPTSSSTT